MKTIKNLYPVIFLALFLTVSYKLNSASKNNLSVNLKFSYSGGMTLVDFCQTGPTTEAITALLKKFDDTKKQIFKTESDRFSGFRVSIIYMRMNNGQVLAEYRNSIGANNDRTNDFYRSIGTDRETAIKRFMNTLSNINPSC